MPSKNKRQQAIKGRLQQVRSSSAANNTVLAQTPTRKDQDRIKRLSNLWEIPLEKIKRDPRQPREHFDHESIKSLAETIRVNGQISPITVTRDGEYYKIETGERRFRAMTLLKRTTIMAIIEGSENELQRASRQLIENIERQDLSSVEKANGLLELKQQLGKTAKWAEVEHLTGLSSRRRKQLLAVKKLPEEIQTAIIEGTLADAHAQELLRLKTPGAQTNLFKRIISDKLSSKDVRRIVSETLQKDINKQPRAIPKFRFVFSANSAEEMIKQLKTKIRELQN